MQQQMQMQQGLHSAQATPVQAVAASAPVLPVAQAIPVSGVGFASAAAGAVAATAMPAKAASAPLDMIDRSEMYDDPKAVFRAEQAAQAAAISGTASAPAMVVARAQPAPSYPTSANAVNAAGKAYVLPPGEVQARAQPVPASASAAFVGALPIGAAIQSSAQDRFIATVRNIQVSQSSHEVVAAMDSIVDLLAKHYEVKTEQNRSQLVAVALAKRQADPKLWDQAVQFKYGALMRAFRE